MTDNRKRPPSRVHVVVGDSMSVSNLRAVLEAKGPSEKLEKAVSHPPTKTSATSAPTPTAPKSKEKGD